MFTQLKLDSSPTGLSFFISIFLFFVLAPHAVAEQHVLVGSYNNPPKIVTDKNGQTLGFWPERIEYISEKEGWVITYVPGSWNEGLERLKNQKIDILPDVTFTKKCEQLYTFSRDPVMVSWSRLYVHKEKSDFESIQDLSWKKIAVLKGSVNFVGTDGFKELAEKFNLPCTFVVFESYDDVFKAIEERTVDAGITNRDFGNKKENDFQVRKTSFIFQPISIKFALPKGSELTPGILSGINEQLDGLLQDRGSIYFELLTKHFESEVAEKKVEVFPKWLENV